MEARERAAPDIIPCLGSRAVRAPASQADRGQELGRDLPGRAVTCKMAWLIALEAEHCMGIDRVMYLSDLSAGRMQQDFWVAGCQINGQIP